MIELQNNPIIRCPNPRLLRRISGRPITKMIQEEEGGIKTGGKLLEKRVWEEEKKCEQLDNKGQMREIREIA